MLVVAPLLLAACSPSTRLVAVAGGGNTLVLLDADLTTSYTISLPPGPKSMRRVDNVLLGSDGGTVYVAGATGPEGTVLRLRTTDGVTIDQWRLASGMVPRALALLPDSRTLLVASNHVDDQKGVVSFLATDSLIELASLTPCQGDVGDLAMLRQGDRVYARCTGALDAVVELDTRLRRIVRTAPLGEGGPSPTSSTRCGPGGIALSRTGTVLFALCSTSGTLLYLDRVTFRPFDSVTVGPGGYRIAVSPRGSRAVLSFPTLNEVVLVDLRGRAVAARLPTPAGPSGVTISPDGRWAFVAARGAETNLATLLKIDLRSSRVVATTTIPRGSQAVSVWPGRRSPVMRWRK